MIKKLLTTIVLFYTVVSIKAQQIDTIIGPIGSQEFGQSITVLHNGNYVVTDPGFNGFVGAVYLYNGSNHSLISTLKGSNKGDLIGSAGITVLSNSNYLVRSVKWNGSRGAITWCNGTTGMSGIVSSSNSLVGSNINDSIGGDQKNGIILLNNGNFVVRSPYWNNKIGAVTWGSGIAGISGTVSSNNSLVNSVSVTGWTGAPIFIDELSNGNYVVRSIRWNGGRGAVTWCNGKTGTSGTVSSSNSLVGSNGMDNLGSDGIIVLSNGNYLVKCPKWSDNTGAVTYCNGSTGISGVVTSSNSLVGSRTNDFVGSGITVLNNGNYVVSSPNWGLNKGSVTWGNGATGVTGIISTSNSLLGVTANDFVGNAGITDLKNGNYVVNSPNWNGRRGAVTLCNGTGTTSTTVSSNNSLVGSNIDDYVGSGGITVLNNGSYVVISPNWNGNRGAVTFRSGSGAANTTVSSSNSLVGDNINDKVGNAGIIVLSNGNYVVMSKNWNGNRGAVTWGYGLSGARGSLSASNSIVGSNPNDNVGTDGITILTNNNYVINSQYWNGGRGAATWCSGNKSVSGIIGTSNSLVGTNTKDRVCNGGILALSNGNYVVSSRNWNGDRGAVTWGDGSNGISGVIDSNNSIVGNNTTDYIGSNGVNPLNDGNYVVSSMSWNGKRGAATWCNGSTGTSGTISSSNSLVGSNANDELGSNGITVLNNGNYIVSSQYWNGRRGAATWCNGSTGNYGFVSSSNSLVGNNANDFVGSNVSVLSNGNYVVSSRNWNGNKGAVTWGDGSNGTSGTVSSSNSLVGTNQDNSADYVGFDKIRALTGVITLNNGDYIVQSTGWHNNRGAVSISCGAYPITGNLSAFNSLIGSSINSKLGYYQEVFNPSYNHVIIANPNENKIYIVRRCLSVKISIEGNDISISNGDTTPSLADSTDMGNTTSNLVRKFKITNNGTDTLKISSIVSKGTNATDFVISDIPSNISAGNHKFFTVKFSASSVGIKNATIKILSNDFNQDTFLFDVSCERFLNGEINVKGNDVSIANGDTTPSLIDSTDMGNTTSNLVRKFKIVNKGTDTLIIKNIISSGIHSSDFIISNIPSKVLAGDSNLFNVIFAPSALGIKKATIKILSNDFNQDTFLFDVSCERLLNAEINVKGNDISISNGDTTPSLSDSTDLGNTTSNLVRRFKIVNNGTDTLKISSIISNGPNATDFVISDIPSNISSGNTSFFTVKFSPSTFGIKNATIEILSNDIVNDTFQFDIKGEKIPNTSINNLDKSNNISIYPNPFTNTLNINIKSLLEDETADIIMMDATGKVVYKQVIFANNQIDLIPLTSGLYGLNIITNNNSYHFKILKNK